MSPSSPAPAVAVRPAGDADAATVRRLSILDSAPVLEGDVLLAFVGGRPVAALSSSDGRLVADPFEPTVVAAAVLREVAAASRPRRVRPSRRRHRPPFFVPRPALG